MTTERLHRVLFMSHPVAGDVPANLARARRWYRWLQWAAPDCAIVCQWLTAIEVLGENDADPVQRERGIRRSELVAQRCDGVLLVGGRVTEGLRREAAACVLGGGGVHDFTYLGDEPPGMEVAA
jgi:hypothetical protein